jgi:heme a synthase
VISKEIVLEDKMKHKMVLWLFAGCFMVFGMVVVGGITRLTGSGLSITEWDVVTGTIPPLNEQQWQEEFDKYKQIPQFSVLNAHFGLEEFKFIYFWEYIHRLFGRLIGVVFLAGFVYFLRKKAISREILPRLIFMFALGGFQGFLGWYMVSSGLSENIRVSHIRLAIHLGFAFITFGYVFKTALALLFPREHAQSNPLNTYRKQSLGILLLLFAQIIYGAFTAGTKAGWIYNTWPLMGDAFMAESVPFALIKEGVSSLMYNLASIQFIHRILAYALYCWICIFGFRVLRSVHCDSGQRIACKWLIVGVHAQVLLGILTLVNQVPMWMGVLHQALAFMLFALLIFLHHRLRYATNGNRT